MQSSGFYALLSMVSEIFISTGKLLAKLVMKANQIATLRQMATMTAKKKHAMNLLIGSVRRI